MRLAKIGLTAGLALLVGCDLFTTDERRVMSFFGSENPWATTAVADAAFSPDDCRHLIVECASMVAPDTVTAGRPFEVIVRTVVNLRGCHGPGGERVTSSGTRTEVIVHDRLRDACVDVTRLVSRTVVLNFDYAGDAVIAVTGRVGGAEEEWERTFEHPVVVVP